MEISTTPQATIDQSTDQSIQNESIFRQLVDAVDEYAIFALDIDGTILTWNAGGIRLKGYMPEEVIGSHFSRFYTEADLLRNHPAHELAMAADRGKYEEEGWRVRKDGTKFWANVVITALRDSHGRLKGFGKVTRDLTQKRSAELALRESEERFRLLVSNVTDYAIITLDIEGHVTSWNPGAERIKGFSSKDIVGKHFSTFYPKSEIEAGKPEMELRIAADEGRYEEEGWRVRKDGTMYWANVSITSMRADNGALRGFAKITRDLTSRRQAEEALRQSQERYKLLVENINDYAILFLDYKGRITSWNTGASRITGYEAKEILGAHFSKFYTPEDIADEKPQRELRIALEGGRYEEEGWRIRKDGTRLWANVIITAVRDSAGQLIGFSKVTRDLTERKAAEDALRESYEELEQRIVDRTRELSESKERAEAAVKTRDEFFSMASHELKTPLSSMKLQTQIRKRNIRKGNLNDFSPDKLESLCEEDERQVERLTFLVDNMLDISRLTSGKFELVRETIDLKELIEDVVARMEPILNESGNNCILEINHAISGSWDRIRIEQVLINLLSNASKYAPGKPVKVQLVSNGAVAQILVHDQGRGIAEADQKRIFESYERIQDHGLTSGLGLGLFISKQIVEAHNGDIRIESKPGEGTTFVIELPLINNVQAGQS